MSVRLGAATAVVAVIVLAACNSGETLPSTDALSTLSGDEAASDPAGNSTESAGDPNGPVGDSTIRVRSGDVLAPIEPHVLGTNVAVWILPDVFADERFHKAVDELGTTLLRFPGGSWSNDYEWHGCELSDVEPCAVPWASNASDIAGLLSATGVDGLWTVAFNRTAQEAAAAVSFFNGEVDDERPIGVDRNGRDWKTVGTWARLRADGGHPDPVRIQFWEIGNEIYGAVSTVGDQCAAWGWENTWTCDPSEYVGGDDHHDGFLDFRDAILAVDPTVEVGAIGVGARGEWSDWDDVVMAEAGDAIDFFAVHHYGSNGDSSATELLEVPGSVWPRVTGDVRSAYEDNSVSPDTPIAVTEHNMVAFLEGDDEQLMTSAANAFYLADTIGQFVQNGVTIGNQWLLVNGPLENGTNYALIDPNGMRRLPAYYAMALWARAGVDMVAVDVGSDLDNLSVYGTIDADGTPRLMVSNPTDEATTITIEGGPGPTVVTADVLTAPTLESQDVTFNGSLDPSLDLAEPAPERITVAGDSVDHTVPPFSLTLLRWTAEG